MAAAITAPSVSEDIIRISTSPRRLSGSTSQSSVAVTNTTYAAKRDLLIVSPYEEEAHQLDLSTLDTASQILAKALADLRFIRDDHRTAPYVDSFNWPEVIGSVQKFAETSGFEWKKTDFYIVVFRSRIPPTTVYSDLGALDKDAHAEATASGGFLKYKFSTPDANGRNLATCVWRNLHDAKVGSLGPLHRKAAGAARHLYTHWEIERLRLVIDDDVKSWDIVKWVD
ncbi:hypothetical protein PZA11_001188 [Diplocarpon coronariae]